MNEEQKELLKEKLQKFFNEKLDSLTNKFENDINSIEKFKYEIFDTVIIPYRKIEETLKEKDKNEETEKKKEDKKIEEKKEPKESLSKSMAIKKEKEKENNHITSTPKKQNKKKEIDFKGKTEVIPKKSRVFSGKAHKPELNVSTTIQEKPKKKPIITLTETNKKKEHERSSKTPLNKKDKIKDKEKEEKKDIKENKNKKTKAISATAYKPSATKRFTAQKKPIDKKTKPEKKKNEKKKDIKKHDIKTKDNKEKDNKEKAEELEKKIEKIIVLKDKSINKIPDSLKNNKKLFNFYLLIKGNYLSKRENYNLILSAPEIYKGFNNKITFLLDDAKKEIKSKISELDNFLNRYGDLPNILSKEFKPSQSALKSLLFVTKEELNNLIKKGDIPKEFIKIFTIISYMLDIKFDENLSDEELMKFFISELIIKNNAKNIQPIITDFISKNKDMKLTKEKVEKIENIINTNSSILSITDMVKINRLLSYCSLLIKDYHDYIILKTSSDQIPYYELRNKYKELQELKLKLATIENNGIPPKLEQEKKEEIKDESAEQIKEEKKEEVKEEVNEIKEENKEDIKEEKKEDNTQKNDIKLEENNKNKEEMEEKKIEELKVENFKETTNISPVENQKVENNTVQTESKEEN